MNIDELRELKNKIDKETEKEKYVPIGTIGDEVTTRLLTKEDINNNLNGTKVISIMEEILEKLITNIRGKLINYDEITLEMGIKLFANINDVNIKNGIVESIETSAKPASKYTQISFKSYYLYDKSNDKDILFSKFNNAEEYIVDLEKIVNTLNEMGYILDSEITNYNIEELFNDLVNNCDTPSILVTLDFVPEKIHNK